MNRIYVAILISLLIPLHAYSQQKTVRYLTPTEIPVTNNFDSFLEGGRANTVVANASLEHQGDMFAASDSGGLFKSTTWGVTWTHVDSLPVNFTQSVIYLNHSANVLLVTAKADFKTENGGGLWRSDDGGTSWKQVPLLDFDPAFTGRLSAYGISHVNNYIAVGTSDGVFLSTDTGATWTHSNPFSLQSAPTYSVLITATRVLAAGPNGVRRSTLSPPIPSWTSPVFSPDPVITSIHAFADSPITSFSAFVVTDIPSLWQTGDEGRTWAQIAPPQGLPHDKCGGAPFVKASRQNDSTIHIFYGSGCQVNRLTAPFADFAIDFDHATWQRFNIDRPSRDLAIGSDDPMLLASNAGLHKTLDHGLNWSFAGGGSRGYNALQIGDFKGQLITSAEFADLYIATRDNKLRTTDVDGRIQFTRLHDAFYIDAATRLFEETAARITWAKCNPCDGRFESKRQLQQMMGWNDPIPHKAAPVLIAGERYIQPGLDGLAQKFHLNENWQSIATFSEDVRGVPKLGRAYPGGDHMIVYQSYKENLTGPPAEGATRLMRIRFADGHSVLFYPFMLGFGGLGSVQTERAVYPVYGVDSRNPYHVIAPDIINQRMMETTNGGESWIDRPDLTRLVTNDGKLLLRADLPGAEAAPLVTAISFSPDDPSLVLMGTSEGGIYMSGDRGATFSRIEQSERIPTVTSFFWIDNNNIFFSTYGRGLWKLRNRQFTVPGAFDQFCGDCQVVAKEGSGAPSFASSALAFGGEILGVRTEKGLLREVVVTQGTSVVFTGDEKDLQSEIAITHRNGKDTGEPLPQGPDGWIASGVVFASDGTLTGAAFSKSELSLLPPDYEDEVKGSTESPTKGKPYIRLTTSAYNGIATVSPNETFTLSGTDFVAGAEYEVLIDGAPIEGKITADGIGAITTRLSAPSSSGYHNVAVRTVDKDTHVVDGSQFLVSETN